MKTLEFLTIFNILTLLVHGYLKDLKSLPYLVVVKSNELRILHSLA